MSDNGCREKRNHSEATSCQQEAMPLTKKQRISKEAPAKRLYSLIVKAMKEKNVQLMNSLYEEYVATVDVVKPELFSMMFCALKNKEDEVYLLGWLKFMNQHDIAIPENGYTSLIRFYAGINKEAEAMQVIDLILKRGLKLKYRNYVPLLQSMAKRGDVNGIEALQSHMQDHGIPQEEEVFYYKLKACLAAREEALFIRCVHAMCSALPLVHQEETLSALNEFTQLYPHWRMQPCEIIASGECSLCGQQLQRIALPVSEKLALAGEIESIIAKRSQAGDAQRRENFEQFKQFLRENGPYDVFVDGANIAHYKQNFEGGTFNYGQIELLTSELQKQGYKVLIVLHEHHFDQQSTDLPERWLRQKLVYKVVKGNNDDWYWMYAALSSRNDAMILSNDKMRDHFFQINNDMRFQRWREYSQIYYDIWTNGAEKKVVLEFPKKYTQSIQENLFGFHFPYGKMEENMRHVKQYFCLLDSHLAGKHSLCSIM